MIQTTVTPDPSSDLLSALRLKLTDYIPHEPTIKQRAALTLPHSEALFGGSVGSGKSDVLLSAALQYVDVPGYNAIIFRKSIADASLPSAILSRSHEWLDEWTDFGVKWNGKNSRWTFPTGGTPATLTFGYLTDERKRYRYQGAEFSFIGFDELTHWRDKQDYTYLRHRLRRTRCPDHASLPEPDPSCSTCREYYHLSKTPLRVRSTCNPGGEGHRWVKEYYSIGADPGGSIGPNGKPLQIGRNPKRPYIPFFLEENPYVDAEVYVDQSLTGLDPITYQQLRWGDWSVHEGSRFKEEWASYYTENAGYWILPDPSVYPDSPRSARGNRGTPYLKSKCRYFQIVDPAASTREGPGDMQVWVKEPSATVITTFAVTPDHHLLVLNITRLFCEIPEIYASARNDYSHYCKLGLHPEFIGVERNGLGIGVFQLWSRLGLPVMDILRHTTDKLAFANTAILRMYQGRIHFPCTDTCPHTGIITPEWMNHLETELYTWTGHPKQACDQIDTIAHGAHQVARLATGAPGEDRLSQSETLPEHLHPEHIRGNGGSKSGDGQSHPRPHKPDPYAAVPTIVGKPMVF